MSGGAEKNSARGFGWHEAENTRGHPVRCRKPGTCFTYWRQFMRLRLGSVGAGEVSQF